MERMDIQENIENYLNNINDCDDVYSLANEVTNHLKAFRECDPLILYLSLLHSIGCLGFALSLNSNDQIDSFKYILQNLKIILKEDE